MLTMSTALHRRRPIGRDYAAYFARPYAVSKTIVLCLVDLFRERRAARAQVRHDVRPRIGRSRSYALIRAWATVVQRDLQVAAVVGDILAGRPTIYTTFLAYDEVAHHSGIERPDSLAVLRDLDRQIARIARALAEAPRPYRLVVLSDHGQSQGETFRDRYGETLEQVVRAACGAGSVAAAESGEDDAMAFLNTGLTEMARDETAGGRTVRMATRGKRSDGAVALGQDEAPDRETADAGGVPELSVMASGCLGLVSFPREPGRVSLERLRSLHPGSAAGPLPPSGHRIRPRAIRAGRRDRARAARDPLSGRRPRRGRGSAGSLRAQRCRPRAQDGLLSPLRRSDDQQRRRPGQRRSLGLRGAGRLPRRARGDPIVSLRPPPVRSRLAGGGGGRRRSGPPGLPRLARERSATPPTRPRWTRRGRAPEARPEAPAPPSTSRARAEGR